MPIEPGNLSDGVTVGTDGQARPTPSADDINALKDELGDYADTGSDAAVGLLNKVNVSAIATSGLGFVNHGVTASATRPTNFASVLWLGSVEPTNAANSDVWVDTT